MLVRMVLGKVCRLTFVADMTTKLAIMHVFIFDHKVSDSVTGAFAICLMATFLERYATLLDDERFMLVGHLRFFC